MGNAVCAGSDNNELTDNLCDADYIRTPRLERVFRAVDRGEYILPEHRQIAYRDQAWRSNHLHLSAPCIYSEVLEGLNLGPGMSFLNLGSGTGYLSTIAGLLLGHNGINHGVEYYDDVIEYANMKLADFKMYSGAIDEFDFCEPKFMQGNCLCLSSDRRYDRVYVGAGCPTENYNYIRNLMKVGGIMVMPFHDQLLQVRRESETEWKTASLLPVNFATLILPKEDCKETWDLMEVQPDSLQALCRAKIRNILRHNIETEFPEFRTRAERDVTKSPSQQRRSNCRHICPTLEDIDDMIQPADLHPPPPPCNGSASRRPVLLQPDSDDEEDMLLYNNIISSLRPRPKAHRSRCASSVAAELTEALSSVPGVSVIPVTLNAPERTAATDQQRRKLDSGLGDEETNDEAAQEDSGQAQTKRTKLGWFNRLIKRPEALDAAGAGAAQEQLGAPAASNSGTAPPPAESMQCDAEPAMRSAALGGDHDAAITFEVDDDDDDDDDNDDVVEEEEDDDDDGDAVAPQFVSSEFYQRRTVDSPFTRKMTSNIQGLPLPVALKRFLLFYRP